MQRSSLKRRVTSAAPMPAIVLSRPGQGGEPERAGRLLAIFMRVVAALWLVEGLVQWSVVMVTDAEGRSTLATLTVPATVAVGFFAIINMVACVGLWMASPWGGVVWLVSVGAQIFIILTMPGFFDHPVPMSLVDLVLVAGYLGLTWHAATAQNRNAA